MSGKSELSLFDDIPPQVVVESANIIDISPLTSLTESITTIDFMIYGSDTEYLDLNDTFLYILLKVTTSDKKSLADAAVVTPANFLLNALFDDVTLALNDTIIEGGNHLYPYKATIESIFGFSKETRQMQLLPMGFNDNVAERRKMISKSRSFELAGALRLDFFNQPKYLLPGVNVKLTLHRSKDAFAFTNGAGNPAIEIMASKLYVRRVRVSPSVIKGHEIGLHKKNALYNYTRSQVVTYSIPTGSFSHFRDNLFSSPLLPKFVIVAMVKSDAFSGDETAGDPFEFKDFGVQSIGLYRDGQSLPYRELYQPNIKQGLYLRDYMRSIIHNTQHMNTNLNNGITLEDFASGNYCFFTFNLTPDFDINQKQLPRDANLRLEIKFRKALPQSINAIVYGTFDTQIQITRDRQIICSHVH
jgi:hypothetical protein